MSDVRVRPATEADVPVLNAIYNGYIVDSHISFDTEPWSDTDRLRWYRARNSAGYPVLVAERSGVVVGASWSGPWRDKAAYRGSVETTVVLDRSATGGGIGSVLLSRLLEDLVVAGFHTAIAVIALPNDASVAMHGRLGYRRIGTLTEVGHKDGRYWDTVLMQRDLRASVTGTG